MSETSGGDTVQTRTRLWVVAGVIFFSILLYFTSGYFVAYTEDAYVRSDFVEVAPEVAGLIQSVGVADDQKVAAGATLAALDPKPFQLAVELKQRQVDSARQQVAVKQDAFPALSGARDDARAGFLLATREFNRIKSLIADQAVSQEAMDRATDAQQTASDAIGEAEANLQVSRSEIAAAQAQVEIVEAELAIAQYDLSRTVLRAPVPGFVTNLSLRPGAYASVGTPLVGIVDDTQWRIVANFKEHSAAMLKPGMRAWIWLDSHPWQFFPARVKGVGRGIAREQGADRLLPYVAPTTDWIRLKRRLPVTLELDPMPQGVEMFMGADARVLLFP
ncbi:MAG: hypothetical protein B7Z15_14080 [Rhizobiales bacterium 32-66-8]|nr:MAG: hypothetical protein B7Z15_14080 [Rhizobiales bacterium 32-66-8]